MGRKPAPSLVRTFAIPAAIAIVSLVGLLAALLGDGGFDATSWVGLTIPIAAIAWAMLGRRRQ